MDISSATAKAGVWGYPHGLKGLSQAVPAQWVTWQPGSAWWWHLWDNDRPRLPQHEKSEAGEPATDGRMPILTQLYTSDSQRLATQ